VARLVAQVVLHLSRSQSGVLGFPAAHPWPPQPERPRFQLLAQERDDVGFGQAELGLDGFERRAVLPGRLDEGRNRGSVQQGLGFGNARW